MASPLDTARVAVVGAGNSAHEVIEPQNPFKGKVRIVRDADGAAMQAAIARADQALGMLSVQFDGWMAEEAERLAAVRDGFHRTNAAPEAAKELFRVAHDLRGQAATLGYPLASRLAESLCHLFDKVAPERIPHVLVDQHVDAIRAVVAERASGDGTPIARTLTERLLDVTNEFVGLELKRAAG